jgi:Flp pilus assembly protein TadG
VTRQVAEEMAGEATEEEAEAKTSAPDAGVSAVEVVLLTPLIIFMIMLVVSLGVLVNEHGQVNAAARDAARAGSLQGTYADAQTQASAAGRADLGAKCTNANIVTSEYVAPTPPSIVGYYRATVTCVVDMSGFGVFGVQQTISATFSAPVDPLQNSNLVKP